MQHSEPFEFGRSGKKEIRDLPTAPAPLGPRPLHAACATQMIMRRLDQRERRQCTVVLIPLVRRAHGVSDVGVAENHTRPTALRRRPPRASGLLVVDCREDRLLHLGRDVGDAVLLMRMFRGLLDDVLDGLALEDRRSPFHEVPATKSRSLLTSVTDRRCGNTSMTPYSCVCNTANTAGRRRDR